MGLSNWGGWHRLLAFVFLLIFYSFRGLWFLILSNSWLTEADLEVSK